jgi:ankyrin repeat protein
VYININQKIIIMKKTAVILFIALGSYLGQAFPTFNSSIENVSTKKMVVVSPFCSAIVQGDLEMVEKLIALGEDINQKSNGKTPLQYAARYNRVEIAKLLLENGAKLNAKCDKGYTALKYAELSKATDVAQLLKSYKE